jgi:hypothetical protein
VTLDEKPLPDAEVRFYPEGSTGGLGGGGRTGPDGKCTLTDARGGKGILPGEYRVVISGRLEPDGSPPDPKAPPIESAARETLPATYSDRDTTRLRATVSRDASVHNFPLKGAAGR